VTAARERLPNRRQGETFNLDCGGLSYTCTISRGRGGRVAEIFLSNHKAGSQADADARDSAVVCSIALQHGVPLETIRPALVRDARGVASSPLGVALDVIAGSEGA
jgi:ribonucleoside-diphosphate reductase alpha chain